MNSNIFRAIQKTALKFFLSKSLLKPQFVRVNLSHWIAAPVNSSIENPLASPARFALFAARRRFMTTPFNNINGSSISSEVGAPAPQIPEVHFNGSTPSESNSGRKIKRKSFALRALIFFVTIFGLFVLLRLLEPAFARGMLLRPVFENRQPISLSRWNGLAALLTGALFCGVAVAKKPASCDCSDDSFRPSKDRIKITRAPEINQTLKALDASDPAQAASRKKILATADTFLQRYMNGDIGQTQDPDGWKNYNGPIMGMSMEEWEKLKTEQKDKDISNWNLCPFAKMVSLTTATNKTTVRYQFTTVGRLIATPRPGLREDKFSAAENGKPFLIDVTLNDQNKVVDRKQMPQGFDASPFAFGVSSLRHQIARMPSKKDDAEITRAYKTGLREKLDGLTDASKICKLQIVRK